jgi:putative ABC transport system substrate-binding protein
MGRLVCLVGVILLVCSTTLWAASKPLQIAMVQWRGETEACRGFKEGLQALGYTVDYTTLNAGQDRGELGRLLRQELEPVLPQFDYVYTFGTTVSIATRDIVHGRVPQLFGVVTDPLGAGLVQSLEAPAGNINGSTNAVPLSRLLEVASKIMPVKRLGLLFNPREKNSMLMRQDLSELAAQWQFDIIDLRAPPVEDMLAQHLHHLADKTIAVDAVFLSSDSYMLTQSQFIGDSLKNARIKSIAPIKNFVDHGALVGIVADYYNLGKAMARMVDQHQQGTPLAQMPVQRDPEPLIVINTTTAALLQVTIPEEILRKATLIE